MPGPRILFAYHKYRGLDPMMRPGSWSVDLPSYYERVAPGSCSTICFEDLVWSNETLDTLFLRECESYKPEIVFIYPIQSMEVDGLQPSYKCLGTLKNRGIHVCLFLGDSWFVDSAAELLAKRWAECCSKLIIVEPRSPWLEKEWGREALLLLWAVRDPGVFYPRGGQRTIDVGFIGSIEQYPERQLLLETLRCQGLEVNQMGGISSGVFLSIDEIAEAYSRTFISLGFTAVEIPGRDSVYPVRGRVWESLLSGCLLFEEAHSSAECFFNPGEDYVSYDGVDDLIEKVDYFRSYREEAQAIAASGLRRMRSEYTPERFLGKLVKSLGMEVY